MNNFGQIIYLLVWFSVFLFARPRKNTRKVILYICLFLSAPLLHQVFLSYGDNGTRMAQPYAPHTDSYMVYYDVGPFPIIKLLTGIFGIGGDKFYRPPTHYLFGGFSEFSASAIPSIFYLLSFLSLGVIKRFCPSRSTGEMPLHKTAATRLVAALLIPVFIHSYFYSFADKESWAYFLIEVAILVFLTVILFQLSHLRYPLLVFAAVVCLLPISSPSSGCLCSLQQQPGEAEQKFAGRYPSMESLPVAIYSLGESFFSRNCPCQPQNTMVYRGHYVYTLHIQRDDEAAKTASILSIAFAAIALWPVGRKLRKSSRVNLQANTQPNKL